MMIDYRLKKLDNGNFEISPNALEMLMYFQAQARALYENLDEDAFSAAIQKDFERTGTTLHQRAMNMINLACYVTEKQEEHSNDNHSKEE